MTTAPDGRYPKLRPIDASPSVQNGRPAILLRDPLQLSDNYVVLPQELGPALFLLDGTRDLAGIRASLLLRFGLPVPSDLLEHLLRILDDNFLLENERAGEAQQRALAAYRSAPFRPPTMAGRSYPADPDDLRRLFDGYLEGVNGREDRGGCPGAGFGVISPHIDYRRGGAVYAAVWQEAREMARSADLVILVGTDHYSMGDRLTLTRQSYATSYGVLPTSESIVDALVAAIGEQEAFAGELRHRGEHSLELVANWLHHVRDGTPVELVPILTGSFGDFVVGREDPASDATLDSLLAALRRQIAGRRVLVVASGDLAHVGPAFGGQPQDEAGWARVKAADQELVQHLEAGSAQDFFAAIRRERDRFNVCGVSPFYLMLRLLQGTPQGSLTDVEGRLVAYDQCPADTQGTSLVSICGMVFG
jgi:AmmeMemoRadiSam system protein B